MSCNCSNNCSCGSGIELQTSQNGADAPYISNIEINTDNSLKFAFSDGSIISTATALTFNTNNLVHVLDSDFTTTASKSFTIPAETFTAVGDKVRFTLSGVIDTDGDNDITVSIDGNSSNAITDTTDFDALFTTIYADGEFSMTDTDTIKAVINIRLTEANFGNTVGWETIATITESGLDFDSDIEIIIAQVDSSLNYFSVEKILNDE